MISTINEKQKKLFISITLITEKVLALTKVLPLILSLHKDVCKVVLGDLWAPDADGVARSLDLFTALLQGPKLLAEVTGSVLENHIIFL